MNYIGLVLNIVTINLLFERRYYNFIFSFVATIGLIAIILIKEYENKIVYFSFLLIYIYSSALSILFGFVIMVFNTYTTTVSTPILVILALISNYLLSNELIQEESNNGLNTSISLLTISNVIYRNYLNGSVYLIHIIILLTLALLCVFFLFKPKESRGNNS